MKTGSFADLPVRVTGGETSDEPIELTVSTDQHGAMAESTCRGSSSTDPTHDKVERGFKRRRDLHYGIQAARPGTSRQVQEQPRTGAIPRLAHTLPPQNTLPALTLGTVPRNLVLAGLGSGVEEALRQLAQRLLAAGKIQLPVIGKLDGVTVLTQQLLLLASDAVEVASEAAPGPTPNGKARLRLLVALVAGAMGSPAPFEKAEAEGIGKRLAGQVTRVRKALGLATDAATEEHSAAHAAADGTSLFATPG